MREEFFRQFYDQLVLLNFITPRRRNIFFSVKRARQLTVYCAGRISIVAEVDPYPYPLSLPGRGERKSNAMNSSSKSSSSIFTACGSRP